MTVVLEVNFEHHKQTSMPKSNPEHHDLKLTATHQPSLSQPPLNTVYFISGWVQGIPPVARNGCLRLCVVNRTANAARLADPHTRARRQGPGFLQEIQPGTLVRLEPGAPNTRRPIEPGAPIHVAHWYEYNLVRPIHVAQQNLVRLIMLPIHVQLVHLRWHRGVPDSPRNTRP